MIRFRSILFAVLLTVPGCFPLDLDSDKKGTLLIPREEGFFLFDWRAGTTTRLPWNGDGLPVHARFAPNAMHVLLTSTTQKGLATEYRVEMMPIQGGAPRFLFKTAKNLHHAVVSPNGKTLALVLLDSVLQNHMPEIHVVDIATGKSTLLADRAGLFVSWLRDSKTLLTITIDEAVKETPHHHGQIGFMDASDGVFTPLANVIADRRCFFAVSPDVKRVLFRAFSAGNADAKLDPKAANVQSFFTLDIDTKAVTKLAGPNRSVEFARYSPDGKKVLLVATRSDRYMHENCDLLVTDADLQNPKIVAKNASPPMLGANLPGWLDEQAIYYFTKVNVYGTAGRALHLRIVNADGSANRDVQPMLDRAVDARTD